MVMGSPRSENTSEKDSTNGWVWDSPSIKHQAEGKGADIYWFRRGSRAVAPAGHSKHGAESGTPPPSPWQPCCERCTPSCRRRSGPVTAT